MISSTSHRPRLAFLGLLAASLACADPTAPAAPVGTYALETYATHALPVVTFENSAQRITLLADTLVLEPGGTGVRILWQRVEPANGAAPATETRTVRDLRLVARGGNLRAQEDIVCLANHVSESCTDLWDAPVALTGGTLQVGPRRYAHVMTLESASAR